TAMPRRRTASPATSKPGSRAGRWKASSISIRDTDRLPFRAWRNFIMGRIAIHNQQEAVPIDFTRMREVARTVLEGEKEAEAEMSLAFVDNATIHTLNKRYLDHDEPTDVLSFPLSEPGGKRLAGELVIGAEVALAQAKERGHDVQEELALYVIHGLLHLCG